MPTIGSQISHLLTRRRSSAVSPFPSPPELSTACFHAASTCCARCRSSPLFLRLSSRASTFFRSSSCRLARGGWVRPVLGGRRRPARRVSAGGAGAAPAEGRTTCGVSALPRRPPWSPLSPGTSCEGWPGWAGRGQQTWAWCAGQMGARSPESCECCALAIRSQKEWGYRAGRRKLSKQGREQADCPRAALNKFKITCN